MSPLHRQLFVVSGAAVNIVGHGCIHGYPSVLFTQLETSGGIPVKLQDHDVSWIGSMIGIVSLVGVLLSPLLMSRYGRQKTHFISTIPALLGWTIFLIANNVPLFLAARVLQGVAVGMRLPLAAILVAEYTDPKHRGALLGTFAVSLGTGVLLAHVAGMALSWRMTAAACGMLPIVSMVIIALSPESPSWLISKGRFDEGIKTFFWLRGDSIEQQTELEAMITSQKAELAATEYRRLEQKKKTFTDTILSEFKFFANIFKKKEFYKPCVISITMLMVLEVGGSHIVPAYGHVILESLLNKKDSKDISWQFTVIDMLRTLSAFVANYLLIRYNRRIVLFTSGILTIISMLFIASFIYLRKADSFGQIPWLNDLAMILIIFYTLSYCMGLIPLAWVICGEVFPLSFRSLGSSLSMCFWTPAFVLSMKSAPHLFSSVGVEGAFLINACILFMSMVILYILLPETKDKTLQEIEDSFKGSPGTNTEVEFRLLDKSHSVQHQQLRTDKQTHL